MTEQPPPHQHALDAELADVADAFAHWRTTRRRSREHTPPPLRARAVTLLDGRRVTHVARALALNPTTLARWASLGAASDTPTAAPRTATTLDTDAFVPLTLSDEPRTTSASPRAEPSAPEAAELIVRWAHGTQLIVNGAVAADTLGAILAAAATAP